MKMTVAVNGILSCVESLNYCFVSLICNPFDKSLIQMGHLLAIAKRGHK
jgi:ethanolamine transporter EutH